MIVNTNKPIIVISKCLGFESCRYNGNIEQNEFIDKQVNTLKLYQFALR